MVATARPTTATRTVWSIDPGHTAVEFAVKHMMFTTVKGRFAGVTGTITLDEGDLTRSAVEVAIDASTIDTREPNRDAHLRAPDFLDAEQYPTITFTSTRVEGDAGDLKVHGHLTIHGVTRPVVLTGAITGRGRTPFGTEVIGVEARTAISRKEFGLSWNVALETGGVLVGDEIKISIDVEAVRQG